MERAPDPSPGEEVAPVSLCWRGVGCPSPRTRCSIASRGKLRAHLNSVPGLNYYITLFAVEYNYILELQKRCAGDFIYRINSVLFYEVFVLNTDCLQALKKTSESYIKFVYRIFKENPWKTWPKEELALVFIGIFGTASLTLKYKECQLWSLIALVRDTGRFGSQLLSVRLQLSGVMYYIFRTGFLPSQCWLALGVRRVFAKVTHLKRFNRMETSKNLEAKYFHFSK